MNLSSILQAIIYQPNDISLFAMSKVQRLAKIERKAGAEMAIA